MNNCTLDYGTLLSPEPIELSIGTIRKPTLRDISKISFTQYSIFQLYLKMNPKEYYLNFKEDGVEYWESLSDEERSYITMFDVIEEDETVQAVYEAIFNFFFVQRVIYQNGAFFLLNIDKDISTDDIKLSADLLRGVIIEKDFDIVLDILQQICCVKDEEIDDSDAVFKNQRAKDLWERMKVARQEQINKSRADINLTLPNIISAVSAKSTNLNIITIWDCTVFQIYDQFNRLQADTIYHMNSISVSVWGDSKKKFDQSLWYKNTFDKKNSLL